MTRVVANVRLCFCRRPTGSAMANVPGPNTSTSKTASAVGDNEPATDDG